MRRPKVHDISGVILNFCRFDRSYRELSYRALGELILSEIYICFLFGNGKSCAFGIECPEINFK